MNAEFVFEPADTDGRSSFAEEQTQAEAAASVRFGAGQHQQDFSAAVGNESLDAVEIPAALGILKGPQFACLQI